MFQVVQGTPSRMWYHVDNADRSSYPTLYVGQLLIATSDGVGSLGQASGVADTSGKKIPWGVVIGTNLATPAFSSTSNSSSITAVDPHSTTTAFLGGEGPYARRGDRSAMVEVALIVPSTVIKGDVRNAAIGTGPTVGVVTTASTTGAGFTCSAGLCDNSTPVGDLGTVYCRSGANMGTYRITTDTSATVKTVGHYFPYDIATGDTFVNVPMRTVGSSYVQTDANALYLNAAANPATDYWIVEVHHLNLAAANQEYVEFRFGGDHFAKART